MTMQRIGKYACLELERRYLLAEAPPDLQQDSRGWRIEDRYITGTRLRLRRMAPLDGGQVMSKLGQKFRAPEQSAVEITMTNLYLNEEEYDQLANLEAETLVKTRFRYQWQEREYGIDVFDGPLQGLVLAETECESLAECQELMLPSFARLDVTDEPFFTGGNLATLTRETLSMALQKWLQA